MRDEPFVYLYREAYSGATNTYYFQILHRLNDDHIVMTEGRSIWHQAFLGCGRFLLRMA